MTECPHICDDLHISPILSKFTVSDLKTLWHFRLGHALNKAINVIKNNFCC